MRLKKEYQEKIEAAYGALVKLGIYSIRPAMITYDGSPIYTVGNPVPELIDKWVVTLQIVIPEDAIEK